MGSGGRCDRKTLSRPRRDEPWAGKRAIRSAASGNRRKCVKGNLEKLLPLASGGVLLWPAAARQNRRAKRAPKLFRWARQPVWVVHGEV